MGFIQYADREVIFKMAQDIPWDVGITNKYILRPFHTNNCPKDAISSLFLTHVSREKVEKKFDVCICFEN